MELNPLIGFLRFLCPTVILSGKRELKIFQHYGYFSSDSTAAGL